jgi:hypothetical protein
MVRRAHHERLTIVTNPLVLSLSKDTSVQRFYMKQATALIILLFASTPLHAAQAPIDVVIPCHEKDTLTLDLCIKAIRRHCKGVKRIVVVSARPLTTLAEWFDEAQYPFTKQTALLEIFGGDKSKVTTYLMRKHNMGGWIYQQLLKLYAPITIPDISPNVLIVDADTMFLRDVEFFDTDGNALYATGTEYHMPYFHHIKRLLPGLQKKFPRLSGVTHHMLMQRPILERLFNGIISIHHCEPWKALCRCIDPREAQRSCISEYEIYFNYAFTASSHVKLRPLKWVNLELSKFKKGDTLGCHYVSCHNIDR